MALMSYLSDTRFIDSEKEFKFACRKLNYYPWDSTSQAIEKRRGWELLLSDRDLDTKVKGAHLVIQSWYDRSLTSSMLSGTWKKHPKSVKQFGRMLDYPNFPPDVVARLREIDGVYMPGHIKPGSAYWEPKKIVQTY